MVKLISRFIEFLFVLLRRWPPSVGVGNAQYLCMGIYSWRSQMNCDMELNTGINIYRSN
jgi:hypothetical protein